MFLVGGLNGDGDKTERVIIGYSDTQISPGGHDARNNSQRHAEDELISEERQEADVEITLQIDFRHETVYLGRNESDYGNEEQESDYGRDDAVHQPLNHERAADESVRSPDEPHNPQLVAGRKYGQTNRVKGHDGGEKRQENRKGESPAAEIVHERS